MEAMLVDVASRLRAVMREFGIDTNPKMADLCKVSVSVVNNWITAQNLPRVADMGLLCDRTGVTLDWIYRGRGAVMDPALTMALGAIFDETKPAVAALVASRDRPPPKVGGRLGKSSEHLPSVSAHLRFKTQGAVVATPTVERER